MDFILNCGVYSIRPRLGRVSMVHDKVVPSLKNRVAAAQPIMPFSAPGGSDALYQSISNAEEGVTIYRDSYYIAADGNLATRSSRVFSRAPIGKKVAN